MTDDPPSKLIDEVTERAYLGSIIIRTFMPDEPPLQPEDFWVHRNREMFRVMQQMRAEGVEIEITALTARLTHVPNMPNVVWAAYVTECCASVGTSLNLDEYGRTILDLATRRRAVQRLNKEAGNVLDLSQPPPVEPDREPPSTSRDRYVVHSAGEALQPQPPLEWIVEPLISRGSLVIFYGEPGSKKTYSLLSLAVCAALGKPWLDFPTRPARTLLIDEESGERRLSLRLAEAIHGALGDEALPLSFVCMAGLQLNAAPDIALLLNLIKTLQVELVIVDSLSATMSGDENSKEDMQPVMNALHQVAAATNAAIVLIHHSGKSGVYRGSSVIKASPDVVIHVTSEDGSPYVNFRTDKNRDGATHDWAARAVWVDGGDPQRKQFYLERAGRKESSQQHSGAQEYVLRYLSEHGESELSAIMSAADACTPEAARHAVRQLAKLGTIYKADSQGLGRGKPARYALASLHDKEKSNDEISGQSGHTP